MAGNRNSFRMVAGRLKVATVLLATILATPGFAAGWKEITPQRVQGLLREGSGLWLIDVRGAAAFARVHIEGAVNIPAATLAHKTFPPQKILVLVDSSLGEMQARAAATQLVNKGQQRVFVLAGGIVAWQNEALPLVGDGRSWEIARLVPEELQAAQRDGVPLEILDLRGDDEQRRAPVATAGQAPGRGLTEKLAWVKERLGKKNKDLAGRLRGEKPVVVVLPLGVEAEALYQRHLWQLPRQVRVVEGGYLAGLAQRQRQTVGECPTCPGN